MQDTFARATHSAYAAGRPSAARDDRISCIQSSDGSLAIAIKNDYFYQYSEEFVLLYFQVFFNKRTLQTGGGGFEICNKSEHRGEGSRNRGKLRT